MSKYSKGRVCPVLGGRMSPAECGEGRGSRYSCPPQCLFSPWAPANYSQALELEAELDRACVARVLSTPADCAELGPLFERASRNQSPMETHSSIVWRLVFETDAAGRTWAQRWEAAAFSGLKNDLQVLMRARMQTRVVLLEVQRVLDSEQVEMLDLIETQPRPFIVRDRGLASSVSRFSAGLTWLYPLPHYHRVYGSALVFPELNRFDPLEVVFETVRHLGGPTDEAPMRRWLAQYMKQFNDALTALALERRRMMFARLDAKFGKAVYELRAPFAACSELLDQEPDVAPDDLTEDERREGFAEARAWFDRDPASLANLASVPGAEQMLGRVLLGQAHWRLEAMGAERLARLRSRFEQRLATNTRFTGERLDDVGAAMAQKDPKGNLALVPPRLLEEPERLVIASSRQPATRAHRSPEEMRRELVTAADREFLDNPVPALDGRTPRAAALDPALRPRLIRLMKGRIRACDQNNLETGDNIDANWMLRELGLHEILFDPPPPGRRPLQLKPDPDDAATSDDDDPFEESEHGVQLMDPELPPAPPLPDRPFTEAEIRERLQGLIQRLDSKDDLIDQLQRDGCTLIEDVSAATEGLIPPDVFRLLIPCLIEIWHVFVPAGTRGWNTSKAELASAIREDLDSMGQAIAEGSPGALTRYISQGAQPALSEHVVVVFMHLSDALPKKSRPSATLGSIACGVLRGVIQALDAAQRWS